jgi:hypothetical protein
MFREHGTGLLAAVRRPEYTGDNRCLPCTVVNVVLAGLLTAAAALVSLPLGVAVATVSLAAIYLRGYLVPGTPELTKRYLPERVLAWFGKADAPATPGETAFDTVGFLDRYGVVVDIGDDVALAPAFERGLDSCPTCGGTIRLGTETVSSCCREYEVVAATCADCDARLFETGAGAVVAAE